MAEETAGLTSSLQLERWKLRPFAHQLVDIQTLSRREHFGLFHEMGCGKSAIVINAACILAEEKIITQVVVISPAAVRGVWLDEELGEIAKHCWAKYSACEFHTRGLRCLHGMALGAELRWVVTNYEYIRREEHRDRLARLIKEEPTLLVLDESSFIKNRRAQQTKACLELARHARRRVILNGTPITNNPLDLWPQLRFLDPAILPYRNYYAFRATYAVMGGWQGKQVVRWVNLDRLQAEVAPHVVRREKKDCLDLPEKVYTHLEAPLAEPTWKLYQEMRDEAIVWLDENPTMAAQAGVRVMRLAQITSGFLGGFEPTGAPREVGDEKLACLEEWLKARLAEDPILHVIVWCRFRAEIERAHRRLNALLPTYRLYGGQGRAEREDAVRRFTVVDTSAPALLVAQPQAGGFGLNLVGASVVVYLSNDFNLLTRRQSEDRVHRPGQRQSVLYVDVVATGPKAQRTVDHAILAALRKKDDLATWTCAAWRAALEAT